MNKDKLKKLKKWAAYVGLIMAGVVIGGDFGLLAAIGLIYLLQ